jgi:nucleoside-diphosphate-sugar epimerase
VCDSKALMAETGWQPQFQLEEGIKRTPGWPGYKGQEQ